MNSIPTKNKQLQKKIDKAVQEFLKKGNKIEIIETNWDESKPTPRRPSIAGEFF